MIQILLLVIYIMQSFKKLMSDYGLGAIIVLLLVAYTVSSFSDYFTEKHLGGGEGHSNLAANAAAYGNGSASNPNDVIGGSDGSFASVAPSTQTSPDQNPADLLPKSAPTEFSPNAANVNNDGLLSAGYHNGASENAAPLRNANLQLRSEEPNPRQHTGPWQQSTIEPDTMRKSIF
jgi:hypothetical protein